MKKYKIILLLLASLLTGCFEDGDCTTTSTDILHIAFRKYESFEVDTVEIIGITIEGTDSLFYPFAAATAITLPLDPNVTSLMINFDFELDTNQLTLDYAPVPRLISPDCGIEMTFMHINADETKHDFDSVAVRASTLDEIITTNIVIYN